MSLLMVRKSAPAHAADAHIDDIAYKYKVGDKIKTPDGVGTVQKKTHTNSGKPAYEVKLDKGGIVVHVEQSVSAAHDSAQDSEIVALWQVLGDAEAYLREGKKNHNVKNVLAAAIKAAEKENPNDRSVLEAKKVLAQFDAADADKSEELEREIKGDVVAVVSGNAARVSKDVSFATAKEGVESFARKNGVSVVASQEYGEAYKFKFSAAIDCSTDAAAEDAASANEIVMVKPAKDSADSAAQDAYIAFPTPPANGKPFPQEARIIEKLKKEMMDFASHVEDAAHHFDFVANVNKRGNTLEEQELYDFYRAWEHKCDSIRAALH